MQLEISMEELRKNKIFVASPLYGGQCAGLFMKALLDLQGLCIQSQIECRFSFIFNESLVQRARNYLADEFLRAEQFTHLLFIDSDICFDPRDVVALLAMNKDVIGAPYPKKSLKWPSVIEAVKRNVEARAKDPNVPEITPENCASIIGDYVFNPETPGQFNVGEPLKVLEIGTGYMLIKREVFTKFRDAYPEKRYKPDHAGQANFDGSRYIYAYFDCVIDRKRTITYQGIEKEVGGSDRYLSEDYTFCQLLRNVGTDIWLCPWMKTTHSGSYGFVGDMAAVANLVGHL
jgi:hypothetical protein